MFRIFGGVSIVILIIYASIELFALKSKKQLETPVVTQIPDEAKKLKDDDRI